MKDLIKKINLSKCLLLFVYAFIFLVLLFFNQYWETYMIDDTPEIGDFNKHYHGKYIVSLLFHITYGLVPTLFDNIHINTWGQTGGAVLYSIFAIMLMSSLSSLFFIKNKKNYLYPLIILTNFIIFYFVFTMEHPSHYYYLYSKTLFCYLLFPFTFLFLFMKKMLTVLLNETKSDKKDIFELSLYAFSMGLSNDIISILTFLFLFVLLCFKPKFKNITAGNILITSGSLLLPFSISLCHSAFVESFKRLDKFFTLGFDNFFGAFNEYHNAFINLSKQDFYLLYLVILFFSVLIYFTYKTKNKKYNTINLILLTVFLLFYLVLFIVLQGYRVNIDYLISNPDSGLQIKLFLLMVINIQAGFLLNDIKHNKKLFIIIFVFLACLSYKYLIPEIKFINDVGIKNYLKEKTHIAEIKEKHKNRYILEHILLWYLYNDKPPVILKHNDYFYLYLEDCNSAYLDSYFYFKRYNYKEFNEYDIEYLDTLDEVIEKYYENGGREITQDEIKEADFNKLLDKDWVLYGK